MTRAETFDRYHDAHFPVGYMGLPVVMAHPLIEAPHLMAYPCSICGRVHLASGDGSLRVVTMRCCETVVVVVEGEPMTFEELADRAKAWVSVWEKLVDPA
jgi:hypothetical protein